LPALAGSEDGDDGFWDDDKQPAQSEPAEPATVIPVTAPKPKEAAPAKAARCTVTRADIEKALGGRKMRVTELATKLGVEVADLIGTFPTTGYIAATAGWVQSTIPITAD
jgi:hypothetical protein